MNANVIERAESNYIPVQLGAQAEYQVPRVGDFVLVPNAGSTYPGSYGYSVTEVLAFEVQERPAPLRSSYRTTTRKYGTGCWVLGDGRSLVVRD